MKKIIWWTVEVEWEDGTREKLNGIPDWVAGGVDEYLTELENEANKGADEDETSLDVTKYEAKDGDEDSFSNLN